MDYNDLLEMEKGRNTVAFFVMMMLLPIFLFILFDLHSTLGTFLSIIVLVLYWILFVSLWTYLFRRHNKKIMQEKQDMQDAEDRFYSKYFQN